MNLYQVKQESVAMRRASLLRKPLGSEGQIDVFHDHGLANENVGKIVSTMRDELSQLDIVIVEQGSYKAIVLIEMEEKNDRPKTLLGDIFGT